MDALDRRPIPSRQQPDEKLITTFEGHIGVSLPSDYRAFLARHGGVWVTALAPIAEPTPFGPNATIESFYGFMLKKHMGSDLTCQSDLAEGAPVVIPIAGGAFGSQIFLFVSDQHRLGIKAGSVYSWDCDNRSSWPDELFHKQFANLAPGVSDYLTARRHKTLPPKPEQLGDYYLTSVRPELRLQAEILDKNAIECHEDVSDFRPQCVSTRRFATQSESSSGIE